MSSYLWDTALGIRAGISELRTLFKSLGNARGEFTDNEFYDVTTADSDRFLYLLRLRDHIRDLKTTKFD